MILCRDLLRQYRDISMNLKKKWALVLVAAFLPLLFLIKVSDNLSIFPKALESSQEKSDDFSLDVNPMFNGLSSSSPKPVQIRMAKRYYWIPRYYIDSMSDSGALEQGGVLIFANLPDFTPRLAEKRDRSLDFKTLDRFVWIHIQDIGKRPVKLNSMYQTLRKLQPSLKYQGEMYGLQFELPDPTPPFNKDLYRRLDESGNLISYIECTRDNTREIPNCSHIFNHEGLLVKISYRKTYLPQWQEIYQKGIDLIDSFKTPPLSQEKGSSL